MEVEKAIFERLLRDREGGGVVENGGAANTTATRATSQERICPVCRISRSMGIVLQVSLARKSVGSQIKEMFIKNLRAVEMYQ